MKRFILTIGFLVSVFAPVMAHSQDATDLQNQITSLKAQTETLDKRLAAQQIQIEAFLRFAQDRGVQMPVLDIKHPVTASYDNTLATVINATANDINDSKILTEHLHTVEDQMVTCKGMNAFGRFLTGCKVPVLVPIAGVAPK